MYCVDTKDPLCNWFMKNSLVSYQVSFDCFIQKNYFSVLEQCKSYKLISTQLFKIVSFSKAYKQIYLFYFCIEVYYLKYQKHRGWKASFLRRGKKIDIIDEQFWIIFHEFSYEGMIGTYYVLHCPNVRNSNARKKPGSCIKARWNTETLNW